MIAAVEPGSPAERAGVVAGERLVSINGHVPSDELDFRWHADGGTADLVLIDETGRERAVTVSREAGESWGLSFADVLFDGVRRCQNACGFCFVGQLPPGLRPSLYVRDDDFRLSFLDGTYITLTNLSEADTARIIEQRLSPLYASLHAVSEPVRASLICATEDRALQRFDELIEAGIEFHVQIVLVPGVNDGDELERTLTWLAEREGVASVGIVPAGYTRHQSALTSSFTDPLAAAAVIRQVQRWQFAMKERDDVSWVHLADEFYLNARAPFPVAEYYDGFPQYENGIGLVRSFVDEATALRDELSAAVRRLPEGSEAATIVTGVMAATMLAGALNACEAAGRVRLLVVPNSFFGGNVAVTGLLTAHDLAGALAADASGRTASAYLLPDVVFNADGVTLDDVTAEGLAERSGCDVRVVSCDARGLLEGLSGVAAVLPSQEKE